MNDSTFQQMVHAVVRRPAAIHPLGEISSEAMHRLLVRQPETLDFGELGWLFECEFEAALYSLPAALRYVEQMREECSQVAEFAMRFIASRRDEIDSLGIGSATLDRVRTVFDAVTGEFTVRSD